MAATQKATALVRAIVDNLNQRLGAGVAVQSFDSNGDAIATVTVGSSNHSVKAIIRVKPVATIQTDALGLTQRVLAPHVTQVITDSNASTPTSEAQKATVLWEAMKLGTKFEYYNKDPGAGNIAVSDITGANLVQALEDLPWRDIGAI